MKRYIISALILAVSCTHAYFTENDGGNAPLCINARINTADSVHTVFVSGAGTSGAISKNGAAVSLQVNGGDIETARVDEDGAALFRKIVKPSDEVHINCSDVSATVSGTTAPMASVINASYNLLEREESAVTVRIQKNENSDNFYIVQLVSFQKAWRDFDNKLLTSEGTIHKLTGNDDNPRQPYSTLVIVDADSFQDSDFCDVIVKCRPDFSRKHDMTNRDVVLVDDHIEYVRDPTYTRIIEYKVRVSALTPDDYWTLRYYTDSPFAMLGPNLDNSLSSLPLETIPKVYPENVNGGLGLVCVRTATELPIVTWECHYTIHNYANPEVTILQ